MAAGVAIPSRVERVAQEVIRRWCGLQMRRQALLRVEGVEHIPSRGPVLLACRHVHHLYDGCALLAILPRRVHLYIALDWVPVRVARRAIERACRLVGWPVVLRSSHPRWSSLHGRDQEEVRSSVRRSVRAGVRVLVNGEALVVFPEGYPNVDPVYTPKRNLEDFAPFLPGFASIVELAQLRCSQSIPIVPVGFTYQPGERWRITMRCGPAMYRNSGESRDAFVAAVQSQVMQLSQTPQFP
jgi:1-acyl-sn-glycerol-3-phosphate acyltransferase